MVSRRSCCWVRPFAAALAVVFLFGVSAPQRTWSQVTRVYGPEDRDVPLPAAGGFAGASDQTAPGLLQSYLQAAGASQWQGIQATGSITYAGNEASPQGSATLTITRDGLTRLDVTSSLGATSLRIRGASGGLQDVQGKLRRLQVRDARLGLFAYPLLLSPRLTEQQGLSITAGTFDLDGRPFNKLSVARPVFEGQTSSRSHGDVLVTDIYFSPDTHLPYKSVDLVGSLNPSPQQYIRVITYEDYREVEGVEIPFRYTETINGQRSWVLQLTAAQPQTQTDPTYFSF